MNFEEELYRLIKNLRESASLISDPVESEQYDRKTISEFSKEWDYRSKYIDLLKEIKNLDNPDSNKKDVLISFLTEMLPSLDYCFKLSSKDDSFSYLFEQLIKILQKRNGNIILPKSGDKFDAKLHHAISVIRSDKVNIPLILDILRPGYQVDNKLLRAAEVKVVLPEIK